MFLHEISSMTSSGFFKRLNLLALYETNFSCCFCALKLTFFPIFVTVHDITRTRSTLEKFTRNFFEQNGLIYPKKMYGQKIQYSEFVSK